MNILIFVTARNCIPFISFCFLSFPSLPFPALPYPSLLYPSLSYPILPFISFHFAETDEAGNDRSETYYLVVIIILAILLVILVSIFTYCFWCNGRRLPNTREENKVNGTNDSADIYENPNKDDVSNYEDMAENEPSMYTDLNRPVVDPEHVYSHLNEVQKDSVNENETVM